MAWQHAPKTNCASTGPGWREDEQQHDHPRHDHRSRAAMNRSKWTLNGAGIYLDSAKKSLAMGRSEVKKPRVSC
uniref:Uncharacterized protein n=1 Tax=Ditylenchus dipsaci TaxID=166011 RepID=A0A915CMY6_9BILA